MTHPSVPDLVLDLTRLRLRGSDFTDDASSVLRFAEAGEGLFRLHWTANGHDEPLPGLFAYAGPGGDISAYAHAVARDRWDSETGDWREPFNRPPADAAPVETYEPQGGKNA